MEVQLGRSFLRTEGISMMKVGGKAKLVCPSESPMATMEFRLLLPVVDADL